MTRIKTIIAHILSRPLFQSTFEGLLNFSLKILNIGEGHTVETSGEKTVFAILQKRLNGRPAIVFDVGAHTGEWFNLFKKHFSGKFDVFCFEPSPTSYEHLMKIESFGFHPEKIALGEIPGKGYLLSESAGSSTTRILHGDSDASNTESEKVMIMTLDHYCSQHDIKHIDLLKIDVEGYELKVLAGASKMIKNGTIDLIQFEFGAKSEEKYSMKEFFDMLNDRYTICRILKHGYYPLKKYRHYYEIMTVTNFIAIKK